MTLKAAKGAKGKADRLASEIVRARANGKCEGPGSWRGVAVVHSGQIQCCHILSRRFSGTRVDLDNLKAMCASCHFYFTAHPVEWTEFIIEKIGRAKYEQLYQKAHAVTKVSWPDEVERLKAIKGAA